MNPIKKLMVIVCVVLFMAGVPTVSYASDADSARVDELRENALHPGMWALMFQIDEDIVPRPFDGMSVAAKYHMSRKTALRLGLSFGFSSNDNTVDDRTIEDDTIRWDGSNTSTGNSQSLLLEALYVRYPWPDSYINAFWGVGPYASFSRSESESESHNIGYSRYQDRYSRHYAVGLKGVLGVEWFASKRISFHAEYQAVIRYRWGFSERTTSHVDTEGSLDERYGKAETDYWSFYGDKVLFGVSMYF
ncbi:MAG: outer membrane beta-barrel protein [Candidatus Krumholzibacteria bacterium]|nr:outer membrane beta-barrel protein [Candidatus Krumholzibacteria bacterium]